MRGSFHRERDRDSANNGNGVGANGAMKKKKRRVLLRKKRTIDPSIVIDYKNPDLLRRFITERGKIIPRRISGATQEQQRKLTVAIKRARFLSLLPYSVAHQTEKGLAGEMQNAIQTFVSATMRGGSRGPGYQHGGRGAPGEGGVISRGGDKERDAAADDFGGDDEEEAQDE